MIIDLPNNQPVALVEPTLQDLRAAYWRIAQALQAGDITPAEANRRTHAVTVILREKEVQLRLFKAAKRLPGNPQ